MKNIDVSIVTDPDVRYSKKQNKNCERMQRDLQKRKRGYEER